MNNVKNTSLYRYPSFIICAISATLVAKLIGKTELDTENEFHRRFLHKMK